MAEAEESNDEDVEAEDSDEEEVAVNGATGSDEEEDEEGESDNSEDADEPDSEETDVDIADRLLQGPNLTSSLMGVLLRFRRGPFAIMGDVEKMFYQVRVPAGDRSLLRFLWWPDGDLSRPLEEYHMNVHLFGATSSPAVANFALRRTAEDFGELYRSEVRESHRDQKSFQGWVQVDRVCQ